MAADRLRSVRLHLVVLVLYALLAVVTSWPLVRHLHTHVPGSDTWALDEYTFLWNTWWFRYSLLNLGQSPLHTDYIFYPLGVSLALYTYNLFNALLSLPLQPFLPLPAISNLTFLVSTVLSGYGTFLLVDSLIRRVQRPATESPQPFVEEPRNLDGSLRGIRYGAAFLSGLIYAFGSYRMVYAAIGHYDMWSTAWIPLYLLFLMRTIHAPGWRNAVLAGICLTLALLCEMIFGVFLGLFTLILLAFALSPRSETAIRGGRSDLLKRIAVMILAATVLYMPVLVPILREMSKGYELAGWGDAEKLSVDLLGLVTPTALHPLGGDWTETLTQTREGTSRFRDVHTVFLGWAGLALAIVGAVRYRRYLAAWTTSLVVFTILSLGPVLQVNGRSTFDLDGLQVNVPLPFILLHYIPVIKANRVPNRFSVVLMLALAVLAGFGAYWLLRVITGRRSTARRFLYPGLGLVAALLLFEHWSAPLPLTDARLPSVYEPVTADGEECTVLQLPLGWRHSFGMQGAEDTRMQYYQTFHHKRLLSGNISRTPPFQFDYFRRVPILDSLIALQTYGEVDAARRAADRATAGEFVSFYNICYVAVAPGIPGRPPYADTRDAALSYVREVLPLERVSRQEGWILYRVKQPPLPELFPVDLGTSAPRTAMVLGEGWAEAEEVQGVTANWAIAQKARFFLPAVVGNDYRLTVIALPFVYPGAPEQRMTLWVNGHRLETLRLAEGWNTYQWQVPARFLQSGLNELSFEFARLDRPAEVVPGNGAIGQTGVQAPTAIEVNSGGPADFAYITVGSGDEARDGSVHRPGYNIAVIHPRSGRILDRRGFDLTQSGSEEEAAALADFIRRVPPGRIVVVALQGAPVYWSEEVVAALREIGGQTDLQGTTDWSHAIIGVKGAAPGTAMEVAGPERGWLRVAPDRRTLAVAVDAMVWERVSQPE